ncbi:ABC transporter permease [[Mycoplasma] anseris]|uniref:ABC transporter permease n=1 Tax=[Mycoplasma] anseris TaxID=92400 RepID=A0A2Z4NDT8_9BACT|nr:ABC transporter permease [[Mycoplasma] anseris]AWX69752.1 ABC transporter permease [[Mycoplasma] anseris]
MPLTDNIKEFNEKYKISSELQDKFNLIPETEKKNITTIAGKPKNIYIEMTKRFFKNPIVTIAFIVFIVMILCSLIIPAPGIRTYDPNTPISGSNKIFFLPPSYSPIFKSTVDTVNADYVFIKDLETHKIFSDYLRPFLNNVVIEENGNNVYLEYNSYDFLFYSDVIQRYNEYINSHTSEVKNWTHQQHIDLLRSLESQTPYLKTILGTDARGADIWITTWYATWRAFKVALIVAVIETIIGVAIGAYIGFHAGKLMDTVIMRIIEIFTSVPELIWLLIFVSFLGSTDKTLIIALILTGWAGPVAGTRMFIITVKDQEYISAAKAVGASTGRQVFVHALPAIIGKIANSFVKRIPATILSISSLAFLGFFKEKNDINLGQLLIDAVPQASNNVWLLLLPALILLLLSVSLHFIAVGIHDCLDPKVMSKRK